MMFYWRKEEKNVLFRMTYLGHLWEETDGERQSQAEGGEAHQSVHRQDEPPLPLQEREPGGTQTRQKHCHFVHLTVNVQVLCGGGTGDASSTNFHCNHYITW